MTYSGTEKVLDRLDITKQICLFREFLNRSWETLDMLMEDHDWHDDSDFIDEWVQVNWEYLVEREIADNKALISTLWMHNSNRRETKKERVADYLVLTKPKKQKKS